MSDLGFPALYGGVLCLDFANTVDGRRTAEPEEHLHSYEDLRRWSAYAQGLDQPQEPAPSFGATALRTALELREAVFRVFAAVVAGQPAAEADLQTLQQAYASAMAAARLQRRGDGYAWRFDGEHRDRPWWPVAVSAIELLTAGPIERVKTCASVEGCSGLFLDVSKNRSRRWCEMGTCGVEDKVHRQAQRRHARRA